MNQGVVDSKSSKILSPPSSSSCIISTSLISKSCRKPEGSSITHLHPASGPTSLRCRRDRHHLQQRERRRRRRRQQQHFSLWYKSFYGGLWFLVFLFVVSLSSAATAFSTTFALRSSSSSRSSGSRSGTSTPGTTTTTRPIHVNSLPSKTLEAEQQQQQPLTRTGEEEVTKDDELLKVPTTTFPTTDSSTAGTTTTPVTDDTINQEGQDVSQKKDTTDNENDDDDENNKNNKMQTPDDEKFKERILSSYRTVQAWETVEWIKECRKVIPWEELRDVNGPYSRKEDDRLFVDDGENTIFLQRFCRWFPTTMTWVNTPPCSVCGHTDCELKTVRGPETEEEIDGNAKRVEVYYCPICEANTTTFPRYNKARKLLDTRKGRCGEYSNLFGLFCRAVGYETRLVLDLSDHLWTEVRLGDSWIMADSCEGVIDKNSMYEHGWGKNGLSYMIAIGLDHVTDVTPRYTRNFLSEDFQMRRRGHTTSENASTAVLQEINMEIRKNNTISKVVLEELDRRRHVEEFDLQFQKQITEWSEQEKYGRGRISGSLAWKQSRSEAGKSNAETTDQRQIAGFEVESFSTLPNGAGDLSLVVNPSPIGRHDGIVVGGAACAIGETNALSIVVVDDKYHGCILQSRSFLTWDEAKLFINRIPSGRIVIMNGKCLDDSTTTVEFPRLGGWRKHTTVSSGIVFIGQVDLHPDWAYFSSLDDCPTTGYEVVLKLETESSLPFKLRTERYTFPRRVVGRLPDSVMSLATQLVASDQQKRLAFTSFIRSAKNTRGYSGYVTKADSPVYLLNSSSYPLSKVETAVLDAVGKEKVWHTFHLLPEPLVPPDDDGIKPNKDGANVPAFEIPLDDSFFTRTLGQQLLTNNGDRLPTSEALYNVRLIGLYFSAHWCGPCRSFTPTLAEMYIHLKEHRPVHGLEIVFVSSDRDESSFQRYFGTMPWLSVPFDQLQGVKAPLNMAYGVRGIPALVILDAVSGQVVIPTSESRQAVGMACRGGEPQIEALLDTWLKRSPAETKEILSMLELSCDEPVNDAEHKVHSTENPYLLAEPSSTGPDDTAARIKFLFEKLVHQGDVPNSAAAKAIEMVANEQRMGRKLDGGALSGKAIKTGTVASKAVLQDAIELATEWNSPAVIIDALKVAAKYVGNAMKEPWSSKFRSFKLSNQVADKITRLEGGLAILQGIGFEISTTGQEFRAIIPVSVDLEQMNQLISQLIDDLNHRR